MKNKKISYLNIGIFALSMMLVVASAVLVFSKLSASATGGGDVTGMYNNEIYPSALYSKGIEAAFDETAKDSIEVDPKTGYLTISKTDIALDRKSVV